MIGAKNCWNFFVTRERMKKNTSQRKINHQLLLKKVNAWYDLPGNSKSKFAWLCDYETTAALDAWEIRGAIPKAKINTVQSILKGSVDAVKTHY